MTRVTGIGGIFFIAGDTVARRARYERHLGIDAQGRDVLVKAEGSEPGRFGRAMDPEGGEAGLRQPPDGQRGRVTA